MVTWIIAAVLCIAGFFAVLHVVNSQGSVSYTGPCHVKY
jgi:hypothetical protein